MLLAALASVAIVTQDQAALRAAPHDSAQQQAVLWQGDTLEIRGARADYLQVYDHRLERGGYIRATQLRATSLVAADASQLLAVLRFVRDTPGAESLGIAYAAAYLKAAPAEAITAEPFDALGDMAERLALRASARQGKVDGSKLAAYLDVAASYGVVMTSFERDGQIQLCYDGDAFRRVLALPASAEQRAHAALALTRDQCVDPNLPPAERYVLDQWRAELLDSVDTADLPEMVKNRVHLRRAGVWAGLAFERSRRGEPATDSAIRALQELAVINKTELADEDFARYTEAAVRVSASRWAAEPAPAPNPRLGIVTAPGEPGETCVLLVDAKRGTNDPLLKHCTIGTVWRASATINPAGTALALAVQPLDTWRELWIFRKGVEGWTVDVLPPANTDPSIGYAEFAGWVPGNMHMLTVREAKVNGRWIRRFEVVRMDTLNTDKQADSPSALNLFYRWQSPTWKQQTLSLR